MYIFAEFSNMDFDPHWKSMLDPYLGSSVYAPPENQETSLLSSVAAAESILLVKMGHTGTKCFYFGAIPSLIQTALL